MWYFTRAEVGQHVPGTETFQVFSMGLHLARLKTALRPTKRLVVTSRNHTSKFIQPVVSRSSVTANEILLQLVATMAKVAARYIRSTVCSIFSGGKSHVCLPYP